MSRINRAPVKDGDTIAAADLNSRFTDFTQTDLNAFNTRDAAIDLPQFKRTSQRGFLAPVATDKEIGEVSLKHTTSVTLNGQTSAPASPYVIGNAAGAASQLGPFGIGLVNITADDVLRVYWNLNVKPKFTGTPWTTADTPSAKYVLPKSGGGVGLDTCTWGSCWVIYLQWDITSASLSNFTEVPFQGDFRTSITGGVTGDPLQATAATSVVPCFISHRSATDRVAIGNETAVQPGWRSVSGSYYYDASMAGTVGTVFGFRLVAKGPMHPYHNGTTNYLVHQTAIPGQNGTDVQLEHTDGRLGFILQRLG